MPPKIDPYATKLQRRIDLILITLIILIIAILVHSSAHGQMMSEWAKDQGFDQTYPSKRLSFPNDSPAGCRLSGVNQSAGLSSQLSPADATSILWNNAAGQAWLTASNWTGNAVPTSTQIAEFGTNPTGASGVGINMNTNGGNQFVGAIYLDSNRTASSLAIGNSSSLSSGTLTLSGVTLNSVNNVVLRNNSSQQLVIQDFQGSNSAKSMLLALGNTTDNVINIDGSGGISISSVIVNGTGNSHLTLAGSGTGVLNLSASNTYTGGTTINSGTLALGNSTNTLADSGAVTVSGGTLSLGANSDTVGSVTLTSGSITGTGTSLLTGSSYDVRSGTISARLGGTGSLNKSTNATVTLSGNNTYTGVTSVTGGTLLVNGSLAAGGSTTVNNSGSILGGSGLINAAVTVNAGAAIRAGTGATASGSLTLSNNLTLNSGSVFELVLGSSHSHSTLSRTGGSWTFSPTQMFSFIDLGATTGTYNNIITGLAADPGTETSWTFANGSWDGTFIFDGANIDLTLTAVPEPSTWFGGFVALATVACSYRGRIRSLFGRGSGFVPIRR